MKIDIKPLANRVVIKPDEPLSVSKGGILLPDVAKERMMNRGEVVAVGPGLLLESGKVEPVQVKVGDTVLYARYAGNDIEVEGEDFKIIPEKEILAVVSVSK